jgi:2-C-methyl-D-erythritol 4-phosphate cytidylyltransferase
VGAVVVAAGSGRRMEGVDKIFSPIAGAPVLTHVLDQLEAFPPLQHIAVVVGAGSQEACRGLVAARGYRKIAGVCTGGVRRQDSVRLGLECLSSVAALDWVMIHDGARPCLDQAILQRGLDAAREPGAGAAVAGVPAKDTIKIVSPEGIVEETPDRQGLWAAQTPQIFRYSLLWEAHIHCQDDVTDDAAMVEKLGHRVKMFLGSHENLKITTHEDLAVAELFLKRRTGKD